MTDATSKTRDVVGEVALTGSGTRAALGTGVPITAPIGPIPVPERVGDLNGDGLIDAIDTGMLAMIVAGRVDPPAHVPEGERDHGQRHERRHRHAQADGALT